MFSMCLVLFSYQPGSERPLVVAANRDEFYARPASSAHHWEDVPGLFAGRDLTAGGTWLGVTGSGRFATVTNFAEDRPGETAPLSRGALVHGFLRSSVSAHEYVHHVHGPDYQGFNLLVYDGDKLAYTSNRGFTEDLPPGSYGLANAELGATWPKVTAGVAALTEACRQGADPDRLLALLHDETLPPDELLPKRGRPLELERRVAPCFIRGDEYGTRASTVVIFEAGQIRFSEQIYLAGGVAGERIDACIGIDDQP